MSKRRCHLLMAVVTILTVAGCDSDKAEPSHGAGDSTTETNTPSVPAKSSRTTGGSDRATSPSAPSAAPSASSSATAEADDGEDCMSLCKRFSKRRAECVDAWVKDIKLPAPAIEKVKANHKKKAEGSDCGFLCEMPKSTEAWGRCAKTEETCEGFHACFKRVSK